MNKTSLTKQYKTKVPREKKGKDNCTNIRKANVRPTVHAVWPSHTHDDLEALVMWSQTLQNVYYP